MVDNDKDLAVASLLAYINFDPDVVIDYKGCDLQTWFINDSNYHNKLIKEAEDGNYKAQQDLQLYNEIVSGESK